MLLFVPDWFLALVFFALGAIVGSFLNVVIYRLHTNKSLGGSSHCLSCGATLSWFELIPLLSYVCLKGSCRHCGARITPRYFIVELLTGLSFVLVFKMFASPALVPLYLVLFSLLIVVVLYDIRHTIIPDELTLGVLVVSLILIFTTHEGHSFGGFVVPSIWVPIGAIISSGFYAALWFFSKGKWIGLGDAKLAFPLGLLVSHSMGVGGAFSLIVWSFWIGAAVSILVLLVQHIFPKTGMVKKRRYLTIKSEIPFAPFLVAAFLLVYVYAIDVFLVTDGLLALIGI